MRISGDRVRLMATLLVPPETLVEQRKAKLSMSLLEEAALHALLRNVNTFMHTDDDFPRRSDMTATGSTDMASNISNSSGLDPPFLRPKDRKGIRDKGYATCNINQNASKYGYGGYGSKFQLAKKLHARSAE